MADMVLDIFLAAHDDFSSTFKKMGVEVEGLRGKIGLLSGGLGVLAGGALAESVKQASDYQSMLQHVAANTTMTTAGIKEMDTAIQDMAAHSSAHMDDLAQAWMHVTDLGFTRAADAQKVVQAAMESALSTGGSVIDTSNVLAQAMHEFSIKATDAGRAMNVLHLASAEGNTTLEAFVDGAGRAIGMAANLGVSLTDAGAAISALTRHGFDASTASTQLVGMLEHITNPAKAARDEIAYLSHVTGVDLVHDFSEAGLHAKGLSGVLADIQKATHGNSAEIEKLIPALRGGLGAMTLTGTGAADFTQILRDLNDTMAGKTNPTAAAYARTQATLSFQIGVLKNNLQEMAIAIGSAVLPILTKLTAAVIPVVQGIATWIKQHSGLVAGLLAGVAVVGTLIGALLVLGPIIAAIASPIGIVVVAIGAAIAGIVALASSSEEVRNILAGIWSAIADAAGALWQDLTGIWNGISGDAMLLWEDLGDWLNQTWTGIVSAAGAIWKNISGALQAIWNALSGAARAVFGPVVTFFAAIWDALTGDVNGATQAFLNLGPAWAAVADALVSIFTNLKETVGLVWSTLVGDAAGAQQHLAALSGPWRTVIEGLGALFSALGKAGKAAWDAFARFGTDAWSKHIKPALDALGKEWKGFVHDVLPLLGPAMEHVKAVLSAIGNVLGGIFGIVVSALKKAWEGFWLHGAQQALSHALSLLGTLLRDSVHILRDALTFLLAVLALNWKVAWDKMKDLVGTTLHAIAAALTGSVTILGNAAGAVGNAIKGVFVGVAQAVNNELIQPALQWGENMMKNLGQGIKDGLGHVTKPFMDMLKWIHDHSPMHSPAAEGPLATMPDFGYYADAIRQAIPQVRRAGQDLVSASGLGTGSAGAFGGSATAGAGSGIFNAGHTVQIAPNITIQGGTFTDKQGIADLAKAVSDEIMHSVRMQGGLLPQM